MNGKVFGYGHHEGASATGYAVVVDAVDWHGIGGGHAVVFESLVKEVDALGVVLWEVCVGLDDACVGANIHEPSSRDGAAGDGGFGCVEGQGLTRAGGCGAMGAAPDVVVGATGAVNREGCVAGYLIEFGLGLSFEDCERHVYIHWTDKILDMGNPIGLLDYWIIMVARVGR